MGCPRFPFTAYRAFSLQDSYGVYVAIFVPPCAAV